MTEATYAPASTILPPERGVPYTGPNIMDRVVVGEARSGAYLGQSRTVVDQETGIFGVVDGMGGALRARRTATRIADTVYDYLYDNFSPADPEGSMRQALDAAEADIENRSSKRSFRLRRNLGAMASFMRFYDDGSGNLMAAYGNIGDTRIYQRDARGAVGRLTHGIWNNLGHPQRYMGSRSRVAGSSEMTQPDISVDDRQIGTIALQPGERYVIASNSLSGGGVGRSTDVGVMEMAMQDADPEIAARRLLRGSRVKGPRAAVVVDIDPSATPVGVAGTGIGRFIPASMANRWNRRRELRRTPEGSGRSASMLGAGAVAGATGWWYSRQARQRENETLRYSGRNMTDGQIKRDRMLAGVQKGLYVAAGVVTLLILKKAGFDIVPTRIPLIGGDGDGVDYLPWNGKSHFHATSPFDARDGAAGYWFDDDPAYPRERVQPPVDVPDVPDVPPIIPPEVPPVVPPEVPTVEVWQPPTTTVTSGDGVENLIHEWGHNYFGYDNFDGADAHRYAETAQARFGEDWLQFADGSDATYIMPDGKVGLRGPGEIKITDETIRRFFEELMAEAAGAKAN